MAEKKVNTDFELDDMLTEGTTPEPVPKAKPKRAAAKRKAAPKAAPVEPEVVDEEFELIEIDPEDDRENWPSIVIDSEDGKPNYEFVAAHGTKRDGSDFSWDMQIMREVEVKVPPSIVYALQDTVAAHYVPSRDSTGKNILIKQNRSAIPWRLAKAGKYLR